jgi:hypothetical protein
MTLSSKSNPEAPTPPPQSARLKSLDQFRGYTVLGMFLVNFVGSFPAIKQNLPLLSHHNTYCSYADTIMPHFLFAVGFSFRMTYLKRAAEKGHLSAIWHAISRNFALLVVAFFVYGLDGKFATWADLRAAGFWNILTEAFQRNFFQTLAHIAVTSLWILPVIGAQSWIRIAYLIFSAVLFHFLSVKFYYQWVWDRPGIDGGPLGFLGWSIPALLGSLAFDWVTANRASALWKLVASGCGVMLLAYALSCLNLVYPPSTPPPSGAALTSYLIEPPFVPPAHPENRNVWSMSQRAGSISYVGFGGGFSLVVYALFLLVCDFGKLELGVFRTLGVNALAGYILHSLVDNAVSPFVPKDSPLWWIFTAFAFYLLVCYACLWHLERHKIYLRL